MSDTSAANKEQCEISDNVNQAIEEMILTVHEVAQHAASAADAAAEADTVSKQSQLSLKVRTLASRTQQSTQEIQSPIKVLQSAAQSAVSAMNESKQGANDRVGQAQKTGSSLQQNAEKVSPISGMNRQIAVVTEQQTQTSESIKANANRKQQASKKHFQRFNKPEN